MDFVVQNTLLSLLLLAAILFAVALGRRTGARRVAKDPGADRGGLGVIEGVVYALLGLVLAFTFNGAGERFLARRAQVGNEVNVIGTAYLRIDVLSPGVQPEMRELFRHYLDLRRQAAQAIPDVPRVRAKLVEASAVQAEMWRLAVGSTTPGVSSPTTMLFLPALNALIDEQTVAQVAMMQHPPAAIESVLLVLILLGAWFVGEAISGMRHPSKLHVYGLALLLSLMVFLIRDLERPMVGLIRVEDAKWLVDDLARMMAPR